MQYKNNFKEYTESGNIDFDENTNAITFINKGVAAVTINNTITLAANENLAIGGNLGEIDMTGYRATFALVGARKLVVITKTYVG